VAPVPLPASTVPPRAGALPEATRRTPQASAAPVPSGSHERDAAPARPAAEAASPEGRTPRDPAGAPEPAATASAGPRPAAGPAPAASPPIPAAAPRAATPDLVLRAAAGLEAQLGAKAREFLDRGRTQLRIALDPPRLGPLRVELDLTEDRASARIFASTAEAAALLTRDREELVRAFQAQGIDDVRVQVETDADGSARRRDDAAEWEDDEGFGEAPAEPEKQPASGNADRGRPRGIDLFA
jgi:flagellar hook-length control protein FliK